RVAGVSVVVLVLSGIYATLDEVAVGVRGFVGSNWGQLVLLKVGLLAATLPLANANRLRNVPGVSTDPRRSLVRLRRFVALELVIVAWVVVATALLVYETPPT
ncbi:MAG TPA: CopD family protein, partial [Vicinamibacterales bacterium]|nr:CopD family protein [Vicinamibacterales bacterium]